MFAAKEAKKQTDGLALSSKNPAFQDRTLDTELPDNLPGSTHFLQRYLGNSYLQSMTEDGQSQSGIPTIQRKCACGGTCASCASKTDEGSKIRPKLSIGPANDVYEQEADWVAEQVLRMPDPLAY